MRILLKHVLVAGSERDLLIEGTRISRIAPAGSLGPDRSGENSLEIIEARGLAAIPSLVNAHAHSAMTLLRSIAEDMELMPWLQQAIWPREARLDAEDIYWGTRLAALEMIRSGTTFCADMYFFPEAQAEAARDSGMRFLISFPLIDGMDESRAEAQRAACDAFFEALPDCGPVSGFCLAGHSVYATTASSLRYIARKARERDLHIHIHLAETKVEDQTCRAQTGMSPTAYLDSLGVLGPKTFCSHCIWLDASDWDLLAERGVTVVHNPVSNMKLSSGTFDYEAARSRGIRVLIGTDGAASNNSLNLFSDMKIAGLLQKHHWRDPQRWPVASLLSAAADSGHEFFATGAGRIEEGTTADLALIDLSAASMTPCHDLAANLVYAQPWVDTTICAGRILMRHGVIEGEAEVIREASKRAEKVGA